MNINNNTRMNELIKIYENEVLNLRLSEHEIVEFERKRHGIWLMECHSIWHAIGEHSASNPIRTFPRRRRSNRSDAVREQYAYSPIRYHFHSEWRCDTNNTECWNHHTIYLIYLNFLTWNVVFDKSMSFMSNMTFNTIGKNKHLRETWTMPEATQTM